MAPGAICECGHTIATKKDARDQQSMQQLTNRVARHATRATIDALTKATEARLAHETEKDLPTSLHGDWKYVEKTKDDKRFDNPDELV